jgi:hypothetical protein
MRRKTARSVPLTTGGRGPWRVKAKLAFAAFAPTGRRNGSYLWFFEQHNVEALIKVIDACVINQRSWVFAGGLTDVKVVLTVRDSVSGKVKTHINPLATPFQPILDTSAFATCS